MQTKVKTLKVQILNKTNRYVEKH